MAEVLVSVVLKKMGSIILDGLEQEVGLVTGVKKEIKILTNTLIIIKGMLEDAEAKQVKNEAVKIWLEEFKDISYDADDILDEWCTRSLVPDTQQPNPNASIIRQVRSYLFNLFSCFKPIVISHGIGMNIKELNERLLDIIEKKQSFNLNKIQSNGIRQIRSIAVPEVPQIYGRVEDKAPFSNIYVGTVLIIKEPIRKTRTLTDGLGLMLLWQFLIKKGCIFRLSGVDYQRELILEAHQVGVKIVHQVS
ncbi:hypothetical protein AQUCO_03300069v1 [Aquilegia coerulea]|uniref:Disease resistance N-terminal domain-containing protein n=1 Tax=Aquilegia coerulea TaxID=218851 RepID=A0A2G5CZB1_AQUCA|nr:hypothetical protein AQUCO_03300069v1 [Aquilegia coerulea]